MKFSSKLANFEGRGLLAEKVVPVTMYFSDNSSQ